MRYIFAVSLLAATSVFAQAQTAEPGSRPEQLQNQQQAPSPQQPPDSTQQPPQQQQQPPAQPPAAQQQPPDSNQQQTPPAQSAPDASQQQNPPQQQAPTAQPTQPAQQPPDTTQQQTPPAQQSPAPEQQPAPPIQQPTATPAQPDTTPAQQPPAPQLTRPKIATTNAVELFRGPTISEVYCSGFITRQSVKPSAVIVTGYRAPDQIQYARGDYIYLKGSDLEEGREYLLLRHMRDPNRFESFRGQLSMLKSLGEMYQDLGRIKVTSLRKRVAIAHIESSCSDAMPGDIAIPFQERPRPEFRQTSFDPFAPPNGKTTGRIVMGHDLDTLVGTHRQVYLNIGEAQGVKPGDYFRVTREYSRVAQSPTESLPFQEPPYDETQKDPPKYDFKKEAENLPRLSEGELMVLSTTSNSATALTTFAPEEIELGDVVEMIDTTPLPPLEVAESAVPEPPTISCSVSRSSIVVGETSNITCNGVAEEGHTLEYSYQASAGQIAPRESRATLTGTAPGPVTVTATAVDDRNLSAQTTVNVDVAAPSGTTTATTTAAAPESPTTSTTPMMLNELTFKPNSVYVDNRAKAVLDDDALRLKRDASATLMIEGSSNPSEKEGLADKRAENAKTYLVRSKGIDAGRIQTRAAQTKTGAKVGVILVPAGAPQQ
jgi:outer membrane protein OmpA-like peptidoglycan-associated protein